MRIKFFLLGVSLMMLNGGLTYAQAPQDGLSITSPAFNHKGVIPTVYTCQGTDINPPLVIRHVPEGAESLALIMDDPDAPFKTWVHWVVFNIPVTESVDENSVPGVQGINDFKKAAYGGPCPPFGTHRYFFKLYALDTMLDLAPGVSKDELLEAMQGHILAEAVLIGKYKK